MEDYPSPAEGNGLENRQAGKTVQGFESLILHDKNKTINNVTMDLVGLEPTTGRL